MAFFPSPATLATLYGLPSVPAGTNRAALGFGFDNDYQPLSFARVSMGEAIGPVGPSPNAALFSAFVGPGEQLLAPSDLHATYDWKPALEQAVRQGKALYAGISNYGPELTRQAVAMLRELRVPIIVHQPKYSMLERTPEHGLLEAIKETGGGSVQHALVYRVRGYALMQQGELDAAADALERSLAVARGADETYELALTLEARGRLAELRGEDGSPQAKESKGLLARLGVVSTPAIPLD